MASVCVKGRHLTFSGASDGTVASWDFHDILSAAVKAACQAHTSHSTAEAWKPQPLHVVRLHQSGVNCLQARCSDSMCAIVFVHASLWHVRVTLATGGDDQCLTVSRLAVTVQDGKV